jgi:hypothetical protein
MTFPTPRPVAQPAKSAPIPKPNLEPRRYGSFQLENQAVGRASNDRRNAIMKGGI